MTGHSPVWDKASKLYISEELPDNRQFCYLFYCSGTGYVFSGDLAANTVNASLMIKYVHLEDVYLRFCLNAKGVEIVPTPYSLFNTHKVPFSPFVYNEIITSHHTEPHEHVLFWENCKRRNTC